MAKTVKEAKADIFLRDTDSQSLFNNSGELIYKYYHEWNDCYNSKTGETAQIDGETYDEEKDSYSPNMPTGYDAVFNGRQSALWDNLVSQYSTEIQDMYKAMRDKGLSYQGMLSKYKEFWKYWCENLYNADAFGYANTSNFAKSYGDKVQMMDYFFNKRQRYLDSKYQCGDSPNKKQRMRLYSKGNGFAIKYYQAIYSSLQWGIGNFDTQRNIKPGTYSYMPFKFESPQNATFDICDADLITELSTYTKSTSGEYNIVGLEGLGNFYFDSDMSIMKRLTKFIMNYTAASPNTYEQGSLFNLSGMPLLKQVIVKNVTNLTKSIILTSDVIEEIDFTGTPITGIQTPPSDTLTKLVLPDTITSLRLIGYSNLQSSGLQVAGYSKIETLDIEDCPNLNSYEIMTACYKAAGTKLNTITMKGINWSLGSVDMLLHLASRKATLTGKINLGETVLGINDKLALMEAWGDIDNEKNSLYISYAEHNVTEVSISGADYAFKTGEYKLTLATKPSSGNNVSSVTWSVEDNDFAKIDKSTGLLTVEKLGSKDNDDKVTVTVSVAKTDGTSLKATKEVRVYKRPISVGDYVFSDGSHGPKKTDSDCTPVAVCFYVEPNNGEWGLAVALADMASMPWGLYNNTNNNGCPNISLTGNPGYSVYDVPSIVNIQSSQNAVSDNVLNNADDASQGFKEHLSNSTLGDLGFTSISDTIYEELKDYLKRAGLSMGDMISAGQLKTLRIMKHRDTILQDSVVNLEVPAAYGDKTELQSLSSCISAVQSKYGDAKYQQYYYPAASECFAYAPTNLKSGEVLDESLGANHWFLPSTGEMGRMSWYYQEGNKSSSDYAIFKQAKADYSFAFVNNWYQTSTEYDQYFQWLSNPRSGAFDTYVADSHKSSSWCVRPVLAFKL